MKTAPLWYFSEIRPSNVDKKSKEGERPVRLVNYTDVYYNKQIDPSLELMHATAPDSQIERFAVTQGDVIITKDSESADDIGIPAVVSEGAEDMVCGYHLALVRPNPDRILPKFLYWYLESTEAKDYWLTRANGVTRHSILTGTISRLPVPDITLPAQQYISEYLDNETKQIDALVGNLTQLAQKLEERRRAVSTAIVADLFDSKTAPLWSVLTPIKDQNHPNEEVLSVYRDYGVIPKSSRDDNHNRTPTDLSSYQLVQPRDVVINKMKAWQGSLGVSAYRGIVSPDYQVARPIVDVLPAYMHAVLRSPIMVSQYRIRSRGIRPSQWRLYWDEFANLHIPLPPLDKQHQIADRFTEVMGKIDKMHDEVTRLKVLLKERRALLITEVITGRKEI